MENYFYVDKNQRQAGPISPDRFAEMGVTAETLVWCKGMSEWTPAGELNELAEYFSKATDDPAPQTAPTTQSVPKELSTQTTHDSVQTQQPSSPFANTQTPANEEIPNHLWLAVLSVVFMVQPLGIFAIHHAAKVNFNVLQGKTYEAMRHSNLAMRWSLIAIVLSILWLIFLLSTFGASILSYLADNYEFAF